MNGMELKSRKSNWHLDIDIRTKWLVILRNILNVELEEFELQAPFEVQS